MVFRTYILSVYDNRLTGGQRQSNTEQVRCALLTPLLHVCAQFTQFSMMKALFMLLLTALANAEENVSRIVSVEDIKFYKLVDYFTERTLRDDSKVRDIGLSPSEYTMHMYLAWRDADKSLSTVTSFPKWLPPN